MGQEKEELQRALQLELKKTRKKLERLEAAIAQNNALLGTGVEHVDKLGAVPSHARTVRDVLDYMELVEQDVDMSDYLGSEDNPLSRPGLGENPPAALLPKDAPAVNPFVYQVAAIHPDEMIAFSLDGMNENNLTGFLSDADSNGISIGSEGVEVLPDAAMQASQYATRKVFEKKVAVATTPMNDTATQEKNRITSPKIRYEESLSALPPEYAIRGLLAIEANNEGILDWQIEKGTVYVSPRWKVMLGEKMLTSSPVDAMLRSFEAVESTPLWQRFDSIFSGTADKFSVMVRIRRAHSSWGWGRLNVLCLRDAEMLPYRLLATLAETTLANDLISTQDIPSGCECIIDDYSDVITRIGEDNLLLYVSPSIRRYLPVTAEEITGKRIDSFRMGEGTTFILEHVRRVFDTGQALHGQFPFVSPLVGPFQADCQFWADVNDKGKVESVTVHLRDVTFAQRVADSYQSLFTGMIDGFALFEYIPRSDEQAAYSASDFALIAMNPAFGRMLPLNKTRPIGYRLSDLMGKDAETWAENCLRRVFEERTTVFSLLKNESRGMFFEVSSYLTEPRKVACIVKNTTELRNIMQEGRLNESRFAALYRLSHMDAAPEEEVVQFSLDQAVQLTGSHHGFLYMDSSYDGNGESVYWSREVKDFFEEGQLPSVPLAFRQCTAEDGSHLEPLRRATIVNSLELPQPLSFGEGLPVNSYMVSPVIEDGKVVCIAGVANKEQDYSPSDLRQLELFINGMWFQLRRRWGVQDLQAAKDEAEAASRAKNEFLANVSHELRTPLNGILGMLQLLQQSPLTPTQLEYVATANYSGRSLLRIISDILDFSRMEAGRFILEPQPFDFAATVRATLGMFIHQAEQKNIRFILRIANNIPKLLMGDDSRVRQIIFNLVGNSFKFTETGAITVECSLLPHCKKDRYCIYFSVADTGIGIPDESLDYIFKAFNQVDGSSTRKYAGTGLGLGIVQRLVHLMNGNLTVESVVGEGTTIHCCLSFSAVEEKDIPVVQPVETVVEVPSLVILVAEDDPINRLTIRSLLQKGGHKVTCVNDGKQALEALMLADFDCLITDIQMPTMDGVELVRRLRNGDVTDITPSPFVRDLLKITPEASVIKPVVTDMPVVALTAHAMTGDREYFLGLGMDYYLSKPIIVAKLNEVLGNVYTMMQSKKAKG